MHEKNNSASTNQRSVRYPLSPQPVGGLLGSERHRALLGIGPLLARACLVLLFMHLCSCSDRTHFGTPHFVIQCARGGPPCKSFVTHDHAEAQYCASVSTYLLCVIQRDMHYNTSGAQWQHDRIN